MNMNRLADRSSRLHELTPVIVGALFAALVVALVPNGGRAEASSPGDLVPVVPARLLDTRIGARFTTVDGVFRGTGAATPGSTIELTVAGRGAVPADALAVMLNVTTIRPAGGGYAVVYPCGSTKPTASTVNFRAGAAVANNAFARVGSGGKVCIDVTGTVDLAVDVTGYVPAGGATTAVVPARLLDTRYWCSVHDGGWCVPWDGCGDAWLDDRVDGRRSWRGAC